MCSFTVRKLNPPVPLEFMDLTFPSSVTTRFTHYQLLQDTSYLMHLGCMFRHRYMCEVCSS